MKTWPFVLVAGAVGAVGLAHLFRNRKFERERRVIRSLVAPTFDRKEFVAATNALSEFEPDRTATQGFLQSYDAAVSAGEIAPPQHRLQGFMFLIESLEGRWDPRAMTPRTIAYKNATAYERLAGDVTAEAFP